MNLLKLIFGSGVGEQLRLAYESKLKAANDTDRIAAEVIIARLEERKAVLAQGGRWITFVQIAWALPFVIYNAKLVVWDKVLGWGVTDPLSPDLYQLQATIIGFFFITTGAQTIVRSLR